MDDCVLAGAKALLSDEHIWTTTFSRQAADLQKGAEAKLLRERAAKAVTVAKALRAARKAQV